LAAFELALQQGADWIETDLRQSLDGVIVCFHDETLGRTTDGKGRIFNSNYQKLKKLDAGSWFSEQYAGEKIPSLNEVLGAIKGRCVLLLELKGSLTVQWGFLLNLKNIIQKHNAWDWVVLQSFNRSMLVRLKQMDSRFRLFHLINYKSTVLPLFVDRIPRWGYPEMSSLAEAVNPSLKILKEQDVGRIQKQGKKVMVWTVDKEEDMIKLLNWGVDGIITNFPDRLKLLQSKLA
jgi:glycerophosphoryl diester phosphodiesterase